MVLNKVEMIELQLNVTLFSCGISHYQEHQLLSAKTYWQNTFYIIVLNHSKK